MPFVLAFLQGTLPSPPYAFGSVGVGSSANISINMRVFGNVGTITINSISVGGVPYSLTGLPTLPEVLNPGLSAPFTLTFTPGSAASFNDILTINWSDFNGNVNVFTGAISGTGILTGLNTSPSPVSFPDTISTHASTPIVVTVKNIGGSSVTINTIAMVSGANFTLSGLPGLPLALGAGLTTTFSLTFNPNSVGPFTDTIHIVTAASGNFDTPVLGNGVLLIPVGISTGVYGLIFAFSNPVTHKKLNPSNLNGQQAGVLIFNGTLWDVPGFEKKLRRIRFWYENYGVAVLTATVSSWRPSVGVDSFDSKTVSASLGTVLADQTERTGFFDIQISGEVIIFQLSRVGGGGPVVLLGFLPEFEDGGEKVEGT